MSQTSQEFQNTLQSIRNKHHQQYKIMCFNAFVDYYQDHIDHLYHMTSQYYDIKYADFVQFVYDTSI
jgi:hypothetical protein